MNLHGTKNEPQEPRRLGNVAPTDLSSNQRLPLPWFCGEEKLTLLWIGRVYDQYTVDAPTEKPGKK